MRVFVVCFGILLPIITLAVEVCYRGCADLFFDPIPTPWHALLVAFVPLANVLMLPEWHVTGKLGRIWLARFNGIALGIAGIYTVLFLPITPLAVPMALFLIGFLPLAPVLSLIATARNRALLAAQLPAGSAERLPAGVVWAGVGLLLVLVAELPDALPRISLAMATSERPGVRAAGLDLLRRHPDQDDLWRLCTQQRVEMSLTGVVLRFAQPAKPAEMREVFYRVTGTVVEDHQPAPPSAWAQWRHRGSRSARRLKGTAGMNRRDWLQLASSQMDATVDAEASFAYLEWTLLFKNTGRIQEEAQAQIHLPPGGVVSRLTLWVDGEPREAAFSGTSEVRAAYESVVRRRQDPVLVTHDGPDRIRVQCFPVPPNDGRMKVRIGVTAPLQWRETNRAVFRLPHFLQRNFGIDPASRHQVWFEGKQPLASPQAPLKVEQTEKGSHALRGSVADEALAATVTVHVTGAAPAPLAWTCDPRSKEHVILQEMRAEHMTAPRQAVLVVDGSARMAGHADAIAQVAVRSANNLHLLVASEQVHDLTSKLRASGPESWEYLRDKIRDLCAGGQDNVAALQQAWELAARTPGSAVVWIHAGQPLLMQPVEPLRQCFRRRPHAVRMFELPVASGRNRVLEELKDVTAVQSLPRLDTLQDDLLHLLASMAGEARTWQAARRQVPAAEARPKGAVESSAHLARLWARDEVTRLVEEAGEGKRKDAVQLAAAHQLVTLVTGAVVLETQEQYKQAGLKPIDPATAPQDFEPGGGKVGSAPEPEVWLLVLVAGAALAWGLYRKRRPCATA